MTLDPRAESARGYVLIGILYIHLLISFAQSRIDPANAMTAFVQIKLLAPHVSVFFFLSGLGAPHIGKRPFDAVLAQSLMLLFLAMLSHAIAYVIGPVWHDPPASLAEATREFVKPLVLGTGYASFVAWFFIVLAIVRLLAWCIGRGWRMALIGCGIFAAVIALGGLVAGTRNLVEWRNVPVALLFFLIGARIPRDWKVPLFVGLGALVLTLALTWLNRPGLLSTGPCLDCDLLFVGQPTLGGMGSPPVYIVQELLFLVFLLWGGQASIALRIDRLSRFFGRYSMQLLLLHGWLLAGLLPLLLPLLPERVPSWFYVTALIASAAFHVLALIVLRPVLDRCLALCFTAARKIVALVPAHRPRAASSVTR